MDYYLNTYFPQLKPALLNLHTYFTTFGWVSAVIFFLLILVCIKLANPYQKRNKQKQIEIVETKKFEPVLPNHQIEAIAGNDLISTQLDLARAYIEMNKQILAKPILDEVVKQGNPTQRREAEILMLNL